MTSNTFFSQLKINLAELAFGLDENETSVLEYCYQMKLAAVYLIILFLVSIIINSTLLLVIYRNKELRTSFNKFIVTLTILNLAGTLFELPIAILNHFYCRQDY